MNRARKSIIITFLFALYVPVRSQITILHLRDSTELFGYISIQRPGRNIEFHQTDSNKTCVLQWSQIEKVVKTLRPSTATFGLDDELELKDGRKLLGQIVEQKPGHTITLYRRDSLDTCVIPISDVIVSRKRPIRSGGNVWLERPYTNIMLLKSGTRQEGLIVEQRNGHEGYLLLLTPGGYTEKIYFSEVEKYEILPRKL